MAHRAHSKAGFSRNAPLNAGGNIIAVLNISATGAASVLASSDFSRL